MALMKEQISVIRNDFLGIGWNANKIWKEHPTFNWSRIAVYDLLKKVKEIESGEQWKGSGWPVSATTKQIANDCELLVRSQEEGPGTQFSIIKIATQKGISNLSVQRILQKVNLKRTNVFHQLTWTKRFLSSQNWKIRPTVAMFQWSQFTTASFSRWERFDCSR